MLDIYEYKYEYMNEIHVYEYDIWIDMKSFTSLWDV